MFEKISDALCSLLKKGISDTISIYDDLISCAIPQKENHDYIIGIYLYDLVYRDALHLDTKQRQVSEKTTICKVMELSYMIYINESNTFGGFNKKNEDFLLEEIIRILSVNPTMAVEGNNIHLSFEDGDIDSKIRLWQSFSKPLQPAVYIRVAPVLIYHQSANKSNVMKELVLHLEKEEE